MILPAATLGDVRGVLPTFVTPSDARAYLDEVATQHKLLNADVTASGVRQQFKDEWDDYVHAWQTFYQNTYPSVGWLNTKAAMDATDSYANWVRGFREALIKEGGSAVSPGAPAPSLHGPATLGDMLPTFVTPDDAKRYMDEVGTDHKLLNNDITQSSVRQLFKDDWALYLHDWQSFYTKAYPDVGWLNTKATMEETDRYSSWVAGWRKAFAAEGGKVGSPGPPNAGQGIPEGPEPAWLGTVKTVAWIGLGLAALYVGAKVIEKLPASRHAHAEE